MTYATVPETAARWSCSVERIHQWLKEGRIKGARKMGRDWLIPAKAVRPVAHKPYGLSK